MYRLEFLPVAKKDMVEIARYISVELSNPTAAENLAVKLIDAIDGLTRFPHANPAYTPIRPLKQEYRKLLVDNYLVFYWVDEKEQLITIVRVVYARRDHNRLLE